MTTTTTPLPRPTFDHASHRARLARIIGRRSFLTLATTSEAGHAHSAGVVYELTAGALWVHSLRSSRKARNIEHDPRVGVTIAYRRLPVGPPFTIHFQARAEVIDMDDPRVRGLLDAGELGSITGHGALDMPDGCFLRIVPNRTVHSFGPGVPTLDLIRDPLGAGARTVQFEGALR